MQSNPVQPMNDVLTRLQQKEATRLKLLRCVYDATDGNTHATVEMQETFTEIGLDYSEGMEVFQYLEHERVLAGHDAHRMSITHEGVKECEAVIRGAGATETEHFSLPAIQQVIIHGSVYGAVQAGGQGNVATVQNESGVQTRDLAPLLLQLRERVHTLPERERTVALEHVDRLHKEMSGERPDTLRMKVWLKGLEAFAPLTPFVAQVLNALANVGA
jgi:hypothetical protein